MLSPHWSQWRRHPCRRRSLPDCSRASIGTRQLTSTVTDNGDLNPYAVIVAPVSVGKIQKDDILVDNFNNVSNLQGTGGTIVDYNPTTKKTTLFAKLPQHLAQCPGGIGLTRRDDDAEKRLGDRRQHAEHGWHDAHQGVKAA